MQRAQELALRGWGRVHPNPMVGAVVLADGVVVGEGYHAEFGGPHAEAVALAAAGTLARGGTLVTTLEPCSRFAKQPACTERIVRAGVRRVVIGMPDPNPAQIGGVERLRAAGVEVETGVLQAEIERQNAVFVRTFRTNPRPFVAVKLATSLDHRIADATGHSRWISGDEARDWVHWFRAGFSAIGVGGRTAQIDDPMLTVRGAVDPRVSPTRVVFLGGRKLPWESNLVRTAREIPTVIVSDQISSADAAALVERGVTVLRGGALPDVMAGLKRHGIDSIVVEGGGRLAGQLLADRLIDRFAWIISPVWLGDGGVPATRGYDVGSLLQAERWVVTERRPLGQDTLLVFDRT